MAAKPRIGPPGGTNTATATEMKNNMVSLDTTSNLTAYWKYVAPKTGLVLIDTCLSTKANGDPNPTTGLYVAGASTRATLDFDEFGDPTNGTARVFQVTQGQTYQIEVSPFGQLLNMTLRISDFGTERDGPVPDLTFSRAMTSYENLAGLNHQDFVSPKGGSFFHPFLQDTSGHFNVQKTLGGPSSASQPDAISCAWQHARQMAGNTFDSFYWGANPANFPYYDPGSTICYDIYSLPWGAPGNQGSLVGHHYRGTGDDFFLGYGDAEWFVDHLTARIRLQDVKDAVQTEHFYWLTEEYGDPDAFGSGLNGTGYEYTFGTNKDPGNIIGMSFACDEWDGGGPDAANYWGKILRGKVFVGVAEGVAASGPSSEWTTDQWRSLNFPTFNTSRYWPGGLVNDRSQKAAIQLDYIGGFMPWVEIPDAILEEAKDQDATVGAGIYISLIPERTDGALPIPMQVCLDSRNGNNPTWNKNDQALLTKFTCEYPDYHLVDYPGFPDSTMLGIGGGPTDSARYFVGRT